jgi:hypothetical protein
LNCRAEGNPAPTYSWYSGESKLIDSGGNFEIFPNGTLVVKRVTEADNGAIFKCEAYNKVDFDYREVLISVIMLPKISSFQKDYFTVEGETVVLSCGALGVPQPTIRWEKMVGGRVDVKMFDDPRIAIREDDVGSELTNNELIIRLNP